jgi:hypothetical protein
MVAHVGVAADKVHELVEVDVEVNLTILPRQQAPDLIGQRIISQC